MIMLILIMGRLRVEAEVPSTFGRADLVIYLPDRIFIIETKFNDSAAKGLTQIIDRRYMHKFLAMGLPIEAVGINVNFKKVRGKKQKLIEIARETIHQGKRKKVAAKKPVAAKKKAHKKASKASKPVNKKSARKK